MFNYSVIMMSSLESLGITRYPDGDEETLAQYHVLCDTALRSTNRMMRLIDIPQRIGSDLTSSILQSVTDIPNIIPPPILPDGDYLVKVAHWNQIVLLDRYSKYFDAMLSVYVPAHIDYVEAQISRFSCNVRNTKVSQSIDSLLSQMDYLDSDTTTEYLLESARSLDVTAKYYPHAPYLEIDDVVYNRVVLFEPFTPMYYNERDTFVWYLPDRYYGNIEEEYKKLNGMAIYVNFIKGKLPNGPLYNRSYLCGTKVWYDYPCTPTSLAKMSAIDAELIAKYCIN